MSDYEVEYKGYLIKPHKGVPSSLIVVTSGQGGKVPNMLTGMYTSRLYAQKDIDIYLDQKGKERKNGNKTITTG